ncbi:hypothetical protein ACMHYJ_14210 [Castellaniella hirudinis]
MPELLLILVAAIVFGCGYVVGHIQALMGYHKRRSMDRRGEDGKHA